MTIASGRHGDVGADRVDEAVAQDDRAGGDRRAGGGDDPGAADGVDVRRIARDATNRERAGDDCSAASDESSSSWQAAMAARCYLR